MLNLRKHSSVSLWWILAASLNHISFQVHLSFAPSLKTKHFNKMVRLPDIKVAKVGSPSNL